MAYRIGVAALLLMLSAGAIHAQQVSGFGSEQEALIYCRGGGVVWLDTATRVYVYKGSPHYGKGRSGAYVCETEAIAIGAHPLQSHRT